MYCKYCMNTIEETFEICPFCGKIQDTATPPHQLMPGTVLNKRYIVGVAKGEGGFGITYIGRDTKLDRLVAIKEYYPTGYVNRSNTVSPYVTEVTSEDQSDFFKKGCDRFLNEAKIIAKFSGEPGIVNVIDYFEENNTAYIIMEYLDGVSLKDYLKETGNLTPDRTLEILRPVMLSLEKIHKQGLIHRDISPSNIMLVDESVKLIDFGAARNASGGGNKSLSLMLKPGYAPEEQYRSKGVQGSWTDVYAICATIYKCVTGITPDEANDRLHSDELKTPSALGISVTPEFEHTLMKGLAVLQKDRYQSIEELLDSFDGKESSNDSEEQTIVPLSSSLEDENATQYVKIPLEDDSETQYEQRDLEDENETQYISEEIQAPNNHEGAVSETAKSLNESRTENTIEKEAKNRIRRSNKTKTIVSIAAALAVCLITGSIIAVFSNSHTGNTSSNSVVSSAPLTSNVTTSSTPNESSSYTRADSDDALISFYKQTVTKSDIEKLKGKYVRTISMTECNVSQDAIDIIPEVSDNVHLLSFDGCTGFHDYSAIAKITNLSTLTIENCEITNDELKTIDFTKIHYLTSLHLNNDKNLTNIDVIKPLAESLLGLYIYSSPISDISVLADFSRLESLFANNCNISDISSLASKPLTRLILANNSIKDISALSDVTTLYNELDLSDNEITTLEPIANNTKLKELNVNRNKLHNLKGLERILRLEKISAAENEIDNLDGITNCTVLSEVNFNVNKLTDISVLGKSTNKLQNVYVNDNNIEDLSCLSNASELQYLSFDNNRVQTIDALKNCIKLCGVSGENNQIQSIESLKNLKTLQYIYFPHNKISDMSAISSLSQDIIVLDLSSNNVSKLMLHESGKCKYLAIYNNPLESLEGMDLVSGYYTIFSYIDNNNLDKLHDRFSYGITILDCPLDQQVNVEDIIGKYWVTFSTLQETEEFIHKTKQSVLTGKTDDN